jgi:large repetitive protein
MRRSATTCLAVILTLVAVCRAFAAGGDVVWQQGDLQAGVQQATASVVDRNGNMIVTGYRNLSGGVNDDYWTVKFKADGSGVAWRAAFDKSGGSDQAAAVALDANNDVIVTGQAWNGINRDIHTIKYNGATGAVIWEQAFNGPAGGNDAGTALGVDSLNNVYIGGSSQNSSGTDDYIVLKYGPDGTPLWQAIWNGPANDIDLVADLAVGPDGVALSGQSKNGAVLTMATVKYDFSGAKLWEKQYAPVGNAQGKKVKMDAAGNVIVTGTAGNAIDLDIYTVKYAAATGAIAWEATRNGAFDDEPYGLALDSAGDVYVTGYTWTLGGTNDFYTARYGGSNGAVVWEGLFDSGNGNTDVAIATGVGIDDAGDIFVTGYTSTSGNYDVQTIKYRRDNGTQLWQRTYNGTAGRNDRPVGIGISPAGEPLIAGWTDNGTDLDCFVIKYDPGALNPPTALTATTLPELSIRLNWVDNSANEDGFTIERKQGETGTYVQIATVGPNTATYLDASPLEPNNYYYYRVRSYNAANGNSHYSNEAHALTVFVNVLPPSWSYLYNNPDNMDDFANAIAVGPDNDPVATGYSLRETGGFDYFTMKLGRADKSVIWSDLYDDVDSEMDVAKCLTVDSGNNAVVSGFSQLYYAPAERNINSIFTIKYLADLPPVNPPNRAWSAQYNGPGAIDDRATAIAATSDAAGSVVVIGYGKNAANNDDIYVIKYAADGSRAWAVIPFDGGGDDIPSAVAVAPDGSVYVTGYSEKGSGAHLYNFFTAKYNGATGALIWSDLYSVTAGGDNRGNSLAIDAGGDLYVTGLATSAAGNQDFHTIKYSGTGSMAVRLWERNFDGLAHGDDTAVGVRIDPIDGAIVVAGTSLTASGDHDFSLVRYTPTGIEVWQKTLQRPGNDDYATALTMDSSGYLYLAGSTAAGDTMDIISLIYDFEGTLLGATLYNGPANGNDEANGIAVNYKGEAFISGYATNATGNADYVVVKQTNGYILVPAPFIALPQADYGRINLTWGNNTPGTTFTVERTLGPVTPESLWTTVAAGLPAGTTAYQDSGLNPDTNYCYRIGAFSGTLPSRKIVACATTRVPAPTLAPLTLLSATAVDVSWNNVAGNTGYRLERSSDNVNWVQIGGTLAAGTTLYHDTGLTAGTVYYYRVSTLNGSGASLASPVQIAPALNAATVVSPTRIDLSWPPVNGSTSYVLERSPDNASWAQIATPTAAAATYSDTTVTPATGYYYRLEVVTAAGTSAPSLVRSATSSLAAPGLTNATVISMSQINLSWSDVTAATGFTVWEQTCNYNNGYNDISYCQTPYTWAWGAWTQVATTGQGVTSYSRSGLSAGYAYQYYVTATAPGGITSPPSNARLAWTTPASPTLDPPAAPADNLVTLSWSNAAGDNGYTLERKTGAGGTYATLATLGINTTTYTDTSVTGETTYYYRVKATGLSGVSDYSNEQSITTPPAGPAITSVTATSSVVATWGNITGNSYYEVRRRVFTYYNRPDLAANPSYSSYWSAWSTVGTAPQDTPTYTDTTVTAGYVYRYSVRASVAGNFTGWGSDAGLYSGTIPATPAGLTATGLSATQMKLVWTDVNGETNYGVQYKVRSGADCTAGAWSDITAIRMNDPALSPYYYTVSGLDTANAYCFQVRSYNAAGSSDWGAAVTCLPPPALNAPSGVTQSQITLTWTNVAGNSGYRVERSTNGTTFSLLTTRPADSVTYTDTGLTAGATYYYRIITANGSNLSAPGNVQSATTQAVTSPTLAPLSGITTSQIALSWTSVPASTGYKVERSPDGAAWSIIAYPAAAATGHTDAGLASGTDYYYRVSAKNAAGSYSVPSNVASAKTLLITPALTVTLVSEARIDLSWPVIFGATSYKVLRSVGPAGPWDQLADLTSITYTTSYCGSTLPIVGCTTLVADSTSYQNAGLTANTDYCYQVVAWSAGTGDSTPSATLCRKTPAVGGPDLTAVTPLNSMKMRLEWSYSGSSCAPVPCDAPDGFEIWKELWNGDWARIATVGNVTGYTDTIGIEPAKRSNYRVRAYKGTDVSVSSNVRGATAPAFTTGDNTCNYRLTITTDGPGTVTVTPDGVGCGTGCEAYCAGAQVTLRTLADTGANFTGWSGNCSGTSPTCSLTIDGDTAVTGSFR